MDKTQQITIYMKNGKTLRFNEVRNMQTTADNILMFSYVSASQGTTHTATFFMDKIAGISQLREEEKE